MTDKKTKVFDTVEDLKWHYHKLYCETGDEDWFFLMERCNSVEEANKYAKQFDVPCRVKTGEDG